MIFKELNIKQKSKIGSGTYKDVYDLKTRPDLVIKTFDVLDGDSVHDVKEEEELSKKYPELFTQIKKVNYKKGYIVQEKVNADSFRNDVDKLKEEIVSETPTSNFLSIDIVAYLFDRLVDNNKDAIVVIKNILTDNNNKKFYNKLVTYLSKLSKVKRAISGIDAHRENFGYNNKKEIKMFDI
jgi:hypothetical protein